MERGRDTRERREKTDMGRTAYVTISNMRRDRRDDRWAPTISDFERDCPLC